MEHLFERWTAVRRVIGAAPRLLLMLDFDGTLSPIVERPEDALLPEPARGRLAALAQLSDVDIGIISGRAAEDVRVRVGLDGLEYVGNHGRERLRPGGGTGDGDFEAKQHVRAATTAFEDKLGAIPGIYLENKGLTLAVHFRRTPASRHADVKQGVDELAQAFADRFHVSEGKMVFDVVPADEVSKGSTTLEMIRERGGMEKVLPIYCGDDTTDETVFRALPEGAVTVCVGGPEKQSAARYRLDDPDEVATFLDRILACRRVETKP